MNTFFLPPSFLPYADMFAVYDATVPAEVAEVNGTRTESYTNTEFTAHMEFTCPWAIRYECADYLMGTVYNNQYYLGVDQWGNEDILPGIVFDPVTKMLMSKPEPNIVPNYFNAFYPAPAQSVGISVWGAEGVQIPNFPDREISFQPYTLAKLTVEYKGFARPGNQTVQQQVSPSFGMRQLPSWGYYWRTDGSPVLDQEAPAVQEVQLKINRTMSGIRMIPPWFYSLAGCVNENEWTDLFTGKTYLPGTLMFVPSNMERTITYARGDDDSIWNIAFELNWNPIGWNNVMRPTGVDTMMKDGKVIYQYPFNWFPTMIYNPLAPDAYEVSGPPYAVHLQREDGTHFVIVVDYNGNVVAYFD